MSEQVSRAVSIGGSAGSLDALSHILPLLPADYWLPIMVVVHLPPDRDSVIAAVLQCKCSLSVREAEDKMPLERGTVYFAPPDYHLLVEEDRSLSLSYDEEHLFSRPSIDVLFESAADVFGQGLVGIILSGANEDGACGLRKVFDEGGVALVQAPKEAAMPQMPLAAIASCPGAQIKLTGEIADFLKGLPHE